MRRNSPENVAVTSHSCSRKGKKEWYTRYSIYHAARVQFPERNVRINWSIYHIPTSASTGPNKNCAVPGIVLLSARIINFSNRTLRVCTSIKASLLLEEMYGISVRVIDSGEVHVVETDTSSASLLDLRYQLFSLTDIPPSEIGLQVGTEQFLPDDDVDGNRTLASVGIQEGINVMCKDLTDTKGQAWGVSERQNKKALAVGDLQKALAQVSLSSNGAQLTTGASSGESFRTNAQTKEFLSRVSQYHSSVCAYEDPSLQDKANKTAPLEELKLKAIDRIREESKSYPTYELALAKELLIWFKETFFKWVNSLDCWSCGSETQVVGMVAPTESELRYGGSRVEQHACSKCGASARFPRYNDAGKLLETRKGRCGEWAQAFTLIAKAAGLRVRVVHDWTDHVWTEIYCPNVEGEGGRWVHADSCENVLDEPLLYEKGWNKKLNYCVATGVDCVMDVTRRYTQDFEALKERRTLAEEGQLQRGLKRMNAEVVAKLPAEEMGRATERYMADAAQIGLENEVGGEGLPGRQSGSEAWINARGEGGDKEWS